MKLTVFNGSPRGAHSNTSILLESFLQGFTSTGENSYDLALLVPQNRLAENVRRFREAEHVLLAFPIYFDAMPAIVKDLIESPGTRSASAGAPTIGYIVHSGLPESTHPRSVERYLEKLASRLGRRHLGTVLKGGTEGLRVPPLQTGWLPKSIIAIGKATNIGRVGHLFDERKMRKAFYDLGRAYSEKEGFDRGLMDRLRPPDTLTVFGFWVVQLSICNFYWNHMLAANHAFGERFSRPYSKE
jgi:NAD(P)H-dependent FMN reductase